MATQHETVDGWEPPGALERKEILDRTQSIAIVGASSNPARASNFVATYLLSSSADYDAELPVVPDMVDVFRRSEDLPEVAEETINIGAKTFWAQLGLFNAEAARMCLDAGVEVVMDRCTKIEHARFAGGLHLAGFDTGVISSRR